MTRRNEPSGRQRNVSFNQSESFEKTYSKQFSLISQNVVVAGLMDLRNKYTSMISDEYSFSIICFLYQK